MPRTVQGVAGERIQLIEDDERIGSSLLRALEGSGFRATWQRTGREGMQEAAAQRPDLVLLDLGLPDVDGLKVCRMLQDRHAGLPVVMLTARDEEVDVVVGLDAGAVDYVAKPFRLAELMARVRAQLRRTASSNQLSVGELVIDAPARQVWCAGAEIELRPKEFDLLVRLVVDAGQVVTRESLMADVWDENWFGSTKTLDFHVAALRRKLTAVIADAGGPITTVRGVGYRFEVP
jgi:DNA-binding response OmpR family regulator